MKRTAPLMKNDTRMKRRIYRLLAFALLFTAGTARDTAAQTFGQNKVQYTKFDWYYLQSAHFDVYFTDGGQDLASFAAHAAEEALVTIQSEFRYQITGRIPFIVYNSHNDFQQTNVIAPYLEEGIGGVTELFKNRVVIPFEGSYKMFRHVIHHELVHAVLNDMFYGGSIQAILTNGIRLQLPLWFNEGLAEYEAQGGWDTNSDMFLRDASTSNYLPMIPRLDGYFAYRGGQSVWWYIAQKYGRQKIGEILNRIRSSRNVDQGFKSAIGLTVEELSERWMKEQKVLYWPDVAKRTSPEDLAKRMTNHTKQRNFYNTSPAVSPTGDKIAFISDRDDYFSVYIMSTSDGQDVRKLVEGQTTNDFEELHLLTPGITWSPDGRSIALAVKAGSNDAIQIIDIESGKVRSLPFELDGIFSVAWSPSGTKIACVGNTAKQSDIWVYDLVRKTTTNLTNDVFSDAQPSWSPDGNTIYFASDRLGYTDPSRLPEGFDILTHSYQQHDIYKIDLESGVITRLTDTPSANESYPTMGPDGKRLLYISDASGISNIYVRDMDSLAGHPITNSLTGVYQMSLSHDGNKLVFTSMYEAGFDIFLLKSPFELPRLASLEETEYILRRNRERAFSDRPARDSLAAVRDSAEHRAYGDSFAIQLGFQDAGADSSTVTGKDRLLFKQGSVSVADRSKQLETFALKNNVDEKGAFVINKYKLSFSPDLVYGNAGFSTFYGVMGTTQMAFSDMLGNHQIYFLTNLIGDLKNSDYALAYYYLPDRIDWGITGFHSARFLYGDGLLYADLYRYRQYGGGLSANFPLDKFNRLEGSLSLMNVTQENLNDPNYPEISRTLLLPQLAYVHDNSLWGMWSPVKGSRYELRAFGAPALKSDAMQFLSLTFDYRKYLKISDDFSFAMRGSGGGSFGRSPQRFFIGGTENWINRSFENGRIPISNVEDFAFLTPVLPLRGYNYNARIATKYLLANAEFRFPLVKYFLGGILPFVLQSVNAVYFIDAGTAVDDFSTFKAFTRDESGNLTYGDLLVGTGIGTRMWFLGFPLKFDIAWAYRGAGFSEPKYYFSLGADF
jgi:hypothetical protein